MSSPSTAPSVPALCPCCHQNIPTPFRCIACGSPFTPTKAGQRYCGKPCAKAWHRKLALGRDTSRPYRRRPRSAATLAATAAKKEQALEALFHNDETVIIPTAPDNTIDDYFAQIMAEAEADERADGLHDIIRPDPDVPSTVTPVLPPKAPQWATTRAARLMAYGPFSI